MGDIRVSSYHVFTWRCSLCNQELSISGQYLSPQLSSGSPIPYTYGCSCGRAYRITWASGNTVHVEEDPIFESIFSISRFFDTMEVRLAWSDRKAAHTQVEHGNWRKALDEAMGMCWRRYREEIIKHIREDGKIPDGHTET